MKYYIYSYYWGTNGPTWGATGLGEFKNMVELYEFIIEQSEDWQLTHVAEITEREYNEAKVNGIIG